MLITEMGNVVGIIRVVGKRRFRSSELSAAAIRNKIVLLHRPLAVLHQL